MVIDQKAPTAPGNYGGLWQMVNGKNVPFGNRLWVKITVPGAVAPTAVPPTATPIPPVQPTLAPAPEIYSFTANATTVLMGDVVTLTWSFSTQDLASARLTRTNPDGSVTQLNGGADVVTPGSYDDLAMSSGTVTYTLVVSSEFGGSSTKSVVVTVTPAVNP
jgi:hypothetical protein